MQWLLFYLLSLDMYAASWGHGNTVKLTGFTRSIIGRGLSKEMLGVVAFG